MLLVTLLAEAHQRELVGVNGAAGDVEAGCNRGKASLGRSRFGVGREIGRIGNGQAAQGRLAHTQRSIALE